jgi:mannose-6-phosphate isomerase
MTLLSGGERRFIMETSDLKSKVLTLLPNRVWRTYFGGKEIERWQGMPNPADGEMPEDWIGSTVIARNPGREHVTDEGLSKVLLETGEQLYLKELIAKDPEGFLGKRHYEKFGDNPGVLVKIIDSLNRLIIQVHPDKFFAKSEMASDYGKTEAWYILGGRKVDGEEPYVLLGFKPGVTREAWIDMFNKQDIQGMINSLHKIYVKPGEMYFIEGGVPHAIGSGCFLIEIQEPTDYTMRVERKTPEGRVIPDQACHQGVGFDKLFDCFHYDSFTLEQTLNRWKVESKVLFNSDEAEVSQLIGEEQTNLFKMSQYKIKKQYEIQQEGIFSLAAITSGEGELEYGDEEKIHVKQGDFLFVPAGVKVIKCKSNGDTGFKMILCHPPV